MAKGIVWPSHITDELIEQGTSLEALKREYSIHTPPSANSFPQIEENAFLTSTDDSGTHCITIKEYDRILDRLRRSLNTTDFNFIYRYIESRISRYYSPRRGFCVAFRGASYYRILDITNHQILYTLLKEDLSTDVYMLHFLVYTKTSVPQEIVLLVLDHLKNNLFKVIYAYLEKSLTESGFFDLMEWYYLDGLAKAVWEMYARTLLEPNYRITTSLPLQRFNFILSKVKAGNFSKLRELEDAKILMRLAARIYSLEKKYDYCAPLLYGGLEIPYALYGYGTVFGKTLFGQVLPIVFSLNRIKKEVFPESIIQDSNGLLTEQGLTYLVPKPLLEQFLNKKGASVVIADNNITTGYSIRVIRDSLREQGYSCDLLVAEVNVQEIRTICEKGEEQREKVVLLRGKDLVCPPVCEYITCFGLQDSSRVVDRVRFLLGKGEYYNGIAYDFDPTIVITRHVHKECLQIALQRLGIDIDMELLPDNTGLTFTEAAERYYDILIRLGNNMDLSKERFVLLLCRYKLEAMCQYDLNNIPVDARTVNRIRDSFSNMQVVISNERLDFVLYVLEGKDLLRHFSYIICEDFALCAGTGEKIALGGKAKPNLEGYNEAARYFKLPPLKHMSEITAKLPSISPNSYTTATLWPWEFYTIQDNQPVFSQALRVQVESTIGRRARRHSFQDQQSNASTSLWASDFSSI